MEVEQEVGAEGAEDHGDLVWARGRVGVRVRVRVRVRARVRIRVGCATHLHGTVHAASDHRSIGRGCNDIRLQGQRPRVVVGHAWRVR